MKYRVVSANEKNNQKQSVICLGNFDGVHLGHQQLILEAVSLAKLHQLTSLFFTIFPSPKSVLGKREEKYLTDLSDRSQLAKHFGIDEMLVLPFNLEVAAYPYDVFINHIILQYQPRFIVCGKDFNFGYKGEGKIQELITLGKGIYEVRVVEDVIMDGAKISTTRIIDALKNKDVEKAAKFLGRNYQVVGKVIPGHGNGTTFGFPTANMNTNNYFLPGNGVYAVNIVYRGKKYPGMANVGIHPTIKKLSEAMLEVHIFDFNQNLYGKKLEVQFLQFIREERKFSTTDELINQLRTDVENIKTLIF